MSGTVVKQKRKSVIGVEILKYVHKVLGMDDKMGIGPESFIVDPKFKEPNKWRTGKWLLQTFFT